MTRLAVVEKIMARHPLRGDMMTLEQMRTLLAALHDVLLANVPGAVVELGCSVGTTSIFIRRLLNELSPSREFHVYDSFDGLPERTEADRPATGTFRFRRGSLRTTKDTLQRVFFIEQLELPKIHTGWFAEIPDADYPEQIAFALFDGDFYTSIRDSFDKVYRRLSPGACVVVDDYDWAELPGVRQATIDFLRDRPEFERMRVVHGQGIMRKL